MLTLNTLVQLLDKYDHLQLECDGLTRVLNYALLHQHAIDHTVVAGRITHSPTNRTFAPHLWIEVPIGNKVATVDYRARMWLGDILTVPHGVFWQRDFLVTYVGTPLADWKPINKMLYDILASGDL